MYFHVHVCCMHAAHISNLLLHQQVWKNTYHLNILPPPPLPPSPSPPHPSLQVFSISDPYVASTEIQAQNSDQLSLVKEQPVRVLDCRRDDWWLVQTIPDYENKLGMQENRMEPHQNGILPLEGWVPADLLHPAHCE